MLELDVEVPRRRFCVEAVLHVAAAERFALFGPSGAGKTTLVETVAGLVRPRHGSVALDGRVLWARTRGRRATTEVPPWDRAVALVRQDPDLFPHLDVRANLAYSRRRSAPGELDRLVRLLELEELLDARPSGLSGGQAHRVALARALAGGCRALLLDEPYAGLDASLRDRVTALVREEVSRRGIPAMLISHELSEAQAFADTIGVVDQGRLLQVAAPRDLVLRPATRRVAELVGYRGFAPAAGASIGVHPDRVRPGSHPDRGPVLRGRLVKSHPSGVGFEADVQVDGARITCRFGEEVGPPGTDLELTVLDPPYFGHDGRILPAAQVTSA